MTSPLVLLTAAGTRFSFIEHGCVSANSCNARCKMGLGSNIQIEPSWSLQSEQKTAEKTPLFAPTYHTPLYAHTYVRMHARTHTHARARAHVDKVALL